MLAGNNRSLKKKRKSRYFYHIQVETCKLSLFLVAKAAMAIKLFLIVKTQKGSYQKSKKDSKRIKTHFFAIRGHQTLFRTHSRLVLQIVGRNILENNAIIHSNKSRQSEDRQENYQETQSTL